MRILTRLLPAALLAAATALAGAPAAAQPGAAPEATEAPVEFHRWASESDFASGTAEGVRATGDGLVIGRPAGSAEHTEKALGTTADYDYARWTSPEHATGFGATEIVTSWNALTPPGTWLQVEVRGTTDDGARTRWYVMGRWASGDTDIRRTSVEGQSDEHGEVNVDVLATAPGTTLVEYQLRATLYRVKGTSASPSLSMIGAMASDVPERSDVPTSESAGAWGVELSVPRYSQNVHAGHYPQYGGGGEAWCSPTSTEMVVEYWGRSPSEEDLAWVAPGHADPTVDHAARRTYDHAYAGAGNWSFNVAYAATYGLDAHVTRLRSLADVERLILRDVPVVTSQSFRADELDGAGYGTDGHIMVVVGFTEDGDVIANDPASSDNDAVRRVYPRAQFEDVWLRTTNGGSGGIAYIITPPDHLTAGR
ncbi:hypothetical protein HDA32_003293 [Spinactinospora alkalitolerans]|uniref:Peptidase C39-like domain-containing protein n=1 Tax=Spinactinospora alkalitolerans TaxID=687207 RepID=A0A852TZG8_9ACTN|nr:C39 family peptidase [Spinactinospora alkalitolerans]NYE48173.1 hypothetical protein [Spinactinospora alkalitolerans]